MSTYSRFNDLSSQYEQSRLCYAIYGISSSPNGHADDVAAATISKQQTYNVYEIVYNLGWH